MKWERATDNEEGSESTGVVKIGSSEGGEQRAPEEQGSEKQNRKRADESYSRTFWMRGEE